MKKIRLFFYAAFLSMAFTSMNAQGTTTAQPGSSQHFVGEFFGGGIVYFVDHTGQHGLVLSLIDISTKSDWCNEAKRVGTTNDWDGAGNSNAIVNQEGHELSAAKLCLDYTNEDYGTGVFSDWYLPSINELSLVWNCFYTIQKSLASDGNDKTTPVERDFYWSSTESAINYAYTYAFNAGAAPIYGKRFPRYVRAIRAF